MTGHTVDYAGVVGVAGLGSREGGLAVTPRFVHMSVRSRANLVLILVLS